MTKWLSVCLLMLIASPAFAQKGNAEMIAANEDAAKIVKTKMKIERPADAKLLEDVKAAEIIVVAGQYDHVEHVLQAGDIKFTKINSSQFSKIELVGQQMLIINCGFRPNKAGIKKIRKFVKAGGFLYTTDWALKDVVQRAFPEFIAWNRVETQDDVVPIRIKRKDNAFLQHLTLSKEEPMWWLEDSSYPIKIVDKKSVEVLIESAVMKKRYKSSPIAVTFPYGDGRVLHIVSHFYLQQNKLKSKEDKMAASKYLENEADLSDAVKGALGEGFGRSKGGNIKSAFTSQQMTSNIVVERKKSQKALKKQYNRKVNKNAQKKLGAGFRDGKSVKVLKKKGKKVKVRTDSGDEGWLLSEDLY